MKHFLKTLCGICIFFTCMAVSAYAEPQIPNGSFENGAKDGWNCNTFDDAENGFSHSDNTDYTYIRSGAKSLKLTAGQMKSGDSKYIISNAQNYTLDTNVTYEITAYVYPKESINVHLTFYQIGSGKTDVLTAEKGKWNKLRFFVKPAKEKGAQILFNFTAASDIAGNEIYMDDVSIEAVKAPCVPNGSFEFGADKGWNYTGFDDSENGFSHSLNTDYAYVKGGGVSLKLSAGKMAASDEKTIVSNAMDYALEKGKSYTITAFVYPTEDISVKATVYSPSPSSGKAAAQKNQWNKLTFPITPAKTGKLQFALTFGAADGFSSAEIYVDGVSVFLTGKEHDECELEAAFSVNDDEALTWERISEASPLIIPYADKMYLRAQSLPEDAAVLAGIYDSADVLKNAAIMHSNELTLSGLNIKSGDVIKLFIWKEDGLIPCGEVYTAPYTDEYVKTFDYGTEGFSAGEGGTVIADGGSLKLVPDGSGSAAATLDISVLDEDKTYIFCYQAWLDGRADVYAVYKSADGDETRELKEYYSSMQGAERRFEVKSISIGGKVFAPDRLEFVLTGTKLEIDSFAAALKYEAEIPSLKEEIGGEYGFKIGTSMSHSRMNNDEFKSNVVKHYNTVTPEGSMLPATIYDADGKTPDFTNADKVAQFCRENGIELVGHALIWEHTDYKKFLTDENGNPVDRETALSVMKSIIETMMFHFSDSVTGWDVVNEAASADSAAVYDNKGMWAGIIGSDYVEYAFEYAMAAADKIYTDTGKKVELYYNDYFSGGVGGRCESIYKIAKTLLDKGMQLDAVCIQSHYDVSEDIESIKAQYDRILELGVDMHISELDISVYDSTLGRAVYEHGLPKLIEDRQYEMYAELFKYFKSHNERIGRVTTWGMTDRHSFRHAKNFEKRDYPLLLDRYYQPKKVFWAWWEE